MQSRLHWVPVAKTAPVRPLAGSPSVDRATEAVLVPAVLEVMRFLDGEGSVAVGREAGGAAQLDGSGGRGGAPARKFTSSI